MKKPPAALDAIVDRVLAYRPKPKSKPARKRARRKKPDHCAHVGAYYCDEADQIKSLRTYWALTVWTTNIHKIKIGGLVETLQCLTRLIKQTRRAHAYIKKAGGIF